MTPILNRVRAHGGDVVRQEWRFSLKRGRLPAEAVAWVRAHWEAACHEAWPRLGAWEERAAIMEYDGGLPRADAERLAYAEVAGC